MVTTTRVQNERRDRDFAVEVDSALKNIEGMIYTRNGQVRPGFELLAADFSEAWTEVTRRMKSGDGLGASRKAFGMAYGYIEHEVRIAGQTTTVYNFFLNGAQHRYDEAIGAKLEDMPAFSERIAQMRDVMAKIDTEVEDEEPDRLKIVRLARAVYGIASSLLFEQRKLQQEQIEKDRTAYEEEKRRRADAKKERHLRNLADRKERDRARTQEGKDGNRKVVA